MLFGIWLIVLGALAVPNLILKRPELKSTLDKITPYQGWIGAISALWGVWGLITSILHLGWLTIVPIWWITLTANNVLLFALGILLGINTLKGFIKDATAQAKMDQTVAKLAPYQGTLGLVALGLGAWCVVASIIIRF